MRRCPDYVRDEIENWIAWSWSGESPEPMNPNRCASAEGTFSALAWEGEDSPEKRVFHRESAERVQRVYEAMSMIARRVLIYEYTKRSHYDQWERGKEIKDGDLVDAWVRVGNNKRERGCIELSISRMGYEKYVLEFQDAVGREFA